MNGQGPSNDIFKVAQSASAKPSQDDDASCTEIRNRDVDRGHLRDTRRDADSLQGLVRKRSKSRNKTRNKTRAKPHSHSLTTGRSRQGPVSHQGPSIPTGATPSTGGREGNANENSIVDADLNAIMNDLEGVEQRTMQLLSSVQKDVGAVTSFMLDCIGAGLSVNVEAARAVVPDIHHARVANRSATMQLRVLDDIGRN